MRAVARGGFGVAVTVAVALSPAGSALAAYSSATESSYAASVSEAVELSGLVASPSYPNWYWTHSDVWKSTDSFAAVFGSHFDSTGAVPTGTAGQDLGNPHRSGDAEDHRVTGILGQ
jgi:hypothetical protein